MAYPIVTTIAWIYWQVAIPILPTCKKENLKEKLVDEKVSPMIEKLYCWD